MWDEEAIRKLNSRINATSLITNILNKHFNKNNKWKWICNICIDTLIVVNVILLIVRSVLDFTIRSVIVSQVSNVLMIITTILTGILNVVLLLRKYDVKSAQSQMLKEYMEAEQDKLSTMAKSQDFNDNSPQVLFSQIDNNMHCIGSACKRTCISQNARSKISSIIKNDLEYNPAEDCGCNLQNVGKEYVIEMDQISNLEPTAPPITNAPSTNPNFVKQYINVSSPPVRIDNKKSLAYLLQ